MQVTPPPVKDCVDCVILQEPLPTKEIPPLNLSQFYKPDIDLKWIDVAIIKMRIKDEGETVRLSNKQIDIIFKNGKMTRIKCSQMNGITFFSNIRNKRSLWARTRKTAHFVI